MEMSGLTVPVIAVVTGEGGCGGALALGVANRGAHAGERGLLTSCSPEGFASHPVEGRLPQRRGLRSDEADGAGPAAAGGIAE